MASHVNVELPDQGIVRPRRLDLGPLLPGRRGGSVLAYHGIPFAQPPTGTRRWRVPQGPLPQWTGVRKSQFPADPVQSFPAMEGMMLGRRGAKHAIKRDEDCFYLNVWVPDDGKGSERPVMVWVYGGAFVVGNTSRPMYDPARLALESGCVVVSLPYRVGPLGFLGCKAMADDSLGNHPLVSRSALSSSNPWTDIDAAAKATVERTAGNWGLWDLVAGLLWVQHSIRHFGGDSDNVTIFGESAGSIAIHYLLLSPAVPRNLFQKAILQSGVAATVPPATAQAAQANYDHIASKLIPDSVSGDRERLEYLRTQVPADAILSALQSLPGRRPRSEYTPRPEPQQSVPEKREDFDPQRHRFATGDMWGPVWDGAMVARDLLTRASSVLPSGEDLRNGRHGIIIGYTADEGSMFNMLVATPSSLATHMSTFSSLLQQEIGALYSVPDIIASGAASTALSKKERHELNRRAYVACATYTGDALFHGPILSYIDKQAQHAAEPGTKTSSPPIYVYAMAYRPSFQWLETISNIPEMASEMGSFHTVEIGFVFGFTGVEPHTWVGTADEYGVDPDTPRSDAAATAEGEEKTKGMTDAERRLSLDVMAYWSEFARSSPSKPLRDWKPLVRPTSSRRLDGIEVKYFGDEPQLSASSSQPSGASHVDRIESGQKRLGELRHFSESPLGPRSQGQAASLAERVEYWTTKRQGSGTTPQLINHYGWQHVEPEWSDW
ncbi:uncharacterized protein PFL1_03744 [Pseudozyma flocculosa PF-1]|uniref:Related to Acetylcholinesterase n=2 Tax=Pseudozyma flocculosa TaxID=84751 RepID=A0A5C3F4F2_9BASI|nr:uncharacterized protein PFL1_03744 [Pseudozyma flocculosa PF-1]EPQ28944.1 hypothetical protein PFL1_03744 [Pseudozyma flocculosa PF-1]SPO38567.1 related to Acetylcholinesterase precursor [Pseudozyma flocculosa]